MSASESHIKATIKYAKEKLKRVPLDLKKAEYEKYKTFSESRGMSMRGFIIAAMEKKCKGILNKNLFFLFIHYIFFLSVHIRLSTCCEIGQTGGYCIAVTTLPSLIHWPFSFISYCPSMTSPVINFPFVPSETVLK